LFAFVCFSGGYNPNDRVIFAVAVTHHENAQSEAHAQHDEAILVRLVIRIKKADRIFIHEYRLSFIERNLMLSLVFSTLILVPLESDVIHTYNVRIEMCDCKSIHLFILAERVPLPFQARA
jgi:hypothetical protein